MAVARCNRRSRSDRNYSINLHLPLATGSSRWVGGQTSSGHQFGGPLMDLGFPLEILWEPATPRLDQRLLCLRLMPKAHGHESGIPPPLEFWGDFGDMIRS